MSAQGEKDFTNVFPSGHKVIWNGDLPEGRLTLAVDSDYSHYKQVNSIYFCIVGADTLYLNGVVLAETGADVGTITDSIKDEWAKFNLEFRKVHAITLQ